MVFAKILMRVLLIERKAMFLTFTGKWTKFWMFASFDLQINEKISTFMTAGDTTAHLADNSKGLALMKCLKTEQL